MAYDLFLGTIKKNWARDPYTDVVLESTAVIDTKATLPSLGTMEEIALVKMKAESGHKPSIKKWKVMRVKVAGLQKQAKRGNKKAIAAVKTINDSGLFGHVQNISGIGSALSHSKYRKVVLKQALRESHGRRPSTRDLYQAKKKVDKTLGNVGVRIQIPGAAPGRITR